MTTTRQAGEAVVWLVPGVDSDMIFTDAALAGEAIGRGFVVRALIPASDLEQVSRERDEAVRLLRGVIQEDDDSKGSPLGGVVLGGLMDCRDNTGCVYQSHSLDQVLTATRAFLNTIGDRDGGEP